MKDGNTSIIDMYYHLNVLSISNSSHKVTRRCIPTKKGSYELKQLDQTGNDEVIQISPTKLNT